jgi:hypothetical protein
VSSLKVASGICLERGKPIFRIDNKPARGLEPSAYRINSHLDDCLLATLHRFTVP